jgi:hypothetical protein
LAGMRLERSECWRLQVGSSGWIRRQNVLSLST